LPLSNSTQTFKSEFFQEYRLDANRLVKQKKAKEKADDKVSGSALMFTRTKGEQCRVKGAKNNYWNKNTFSPKDTINCNLYQKLYSSSSQAKIMQYLWSAILVYKSTQIFVSYLLGFTKTHLVGMKGQK